MITIKRINGLHHPRAIRTVELRSDHDVERGATLRRRDIMRRRDTSGERGPSGIERGQVTLLDGRTTRAMRTALESSLRDIAARFELRAQVVRAVAHDGSATFTVLLAVSNARS
jgi:hypothetical protein